MRVLSGRASPNFYICHYYRLCIIDRTFYVSDTFDIILVFSSCAKKKRVTKSSANRTIKCSIFWLWWQRLHFKIVILCVKVEIHLRRGCHVRLHKHETTYAVERLTAYRLYQQFIYGHQRTACGWYVIINILINDNNNIIFKYCLLTVHWISSTNHTQLHYCSYQL